MATKNTVPVIPKEYLKNKRAKFYRAFIPKDNEPIDIHTDVDYFYLEPVAAIEGLINEMHLYDINEDGGLANLDSSKNIIVLVIIKVDSDEIDKDTPLNMNGVSVNLRLKELGFDCKTQDITITDIQIKIDPQTGWRKVECVEYEKVQ